MQEINKQIKAIEQNIDKLISFSSNQFPTDKQNFKKTESILKEQIVRFEILTEENYLLSINANSVFVKM